jgi:hypothetical protein
MYSITKGGNVMKQDGSGIAEGWDDFTTMDEGFGFV